MKEKERQKVNKEKLIKKDHGAKGPNPKNLVINKVPGKKIKNPKRFQKANLSTFPLFGPSIFLSKNIMNQGKMM